MSSLIKELIKLKFQVTYSQHFTELRSLPRFYFRQCLFWDFPDHSFKCYGKDHNKLVNYLPMNLSKVLLIVKKNILLSSCCGFLRIENNQNLEIIFNRTISKERENRWLEERKNFNFWKWLNLSKSINSIPVLQLFNS